MKITVDNNYRANTQQVNIIPVINPFILVFNFIDGISHCMTYFSGLRSIDKNPIDMTVIRLKTMKYVKYESVQEMVNFLNEWRLNYFNPDFKGGCI
jgi:hypothetical protein